MHFLNTLYNLLLVVELLNLEGTVIKPILFFAKIGSCQQDFHGILFNNYVCAERISTRSDLPEVEIMDIFYIWNLI